MHISRNVVPLLGLLGGGLFALRATAYETNVLVRDPSTIVERNGTYWVYGTGRGTQQFSSTDRVHWTKRGSVFAQAPAWVAQKVPGNTTNEVWAPDVHLMNVFPLLFALTVRHQRFGPWCGDEPTIRAR